MNIIYIYWRLESVDAVIDDHKCAKRSTLTRHGKSLRQKNVHTDIHKSIGQNAFGDGLNGFFVPTFVLDSDRRGY